LELPAGARSARAMFTTLGNIGVRFTSAPQNGDGHGN
jgi:hypothetical protein